MILRGRVAAGGDVPGSVRFSMNGALAGHVITGCPAPSASFAAGAEAHVAIRPEDITVSPEMRDGPGGNVLVGVIDALLFVGDGPDTMLLLLPRSQEWREGQRVHLALPPDTVSVWPA